MREIKGIGRINRSSIEALIEQTKALRREGFDFVQRAGKLGLPLLLSDKNDLDHVFNCAIAELLVTYEANLEDLRLILNTHFDRVTLRSRFSDRSGRLDLLNANSLTPRAKRIITGIAYPWYNQWLYLDLARVTRAYNLDVNRYSQIFGRYRYFRSYPLSSTKFRLVDGYLEIAADRYRNMIVFGDTSRIYRSQEIFEHRGFVLPNDLGNMFLVGFRNGVIRMGVVRRSAVDELHGILTTVTRASGRPFSSRVIMVKQGMNKLYDLEIPLDSDKGFDPKSRQYEYLNSQLERYNRGSVFESDGFMWADPT